MKGSKVLDSLSIKQLVGIWTFGIIVFGILYFSLLSTSHHLTNNNESLTANANGFVNSLYFSFITALTIGYGNIAPLGFSKLLVIIEAIFSITILGLLLAKIVGIKQDEILSQVEELSFEESTNSAISELYIFRSDIRNISESVKSSKKINSELKSFEQSLNTLNLAFKDIENATNKLNAGEKKNSNLRIELITSSINFSLSRMIELLEAFNHRKTSWKKELTTTRITECIRITKKLCDEHNFVASESDKSIIGKKLEDLNKTLSTLQEIISKA